MFKTAAELKKFILWAKAEKVEALKVGDIEIRFSPVALIDTADMGAPIHDLRTPEQRKLDEEREFNDILFHSAR